MTAHTWIRHFLRISFVFLLFLIQNHELLWGAAEEDQSDPARAAIARAIEAMGGDAYLNMNASASRGRYFRFRKNRKFFTQYRDWTMYSPTKWRFQMGEGKRQFVQIYNLELSKGWVLDGESSVEDVPDEEIENFRKSARQDLDILLRDRVDEEGMNLYYYSPDDIEGAGSYEAVEFLDSTNDSIVVFFDLKTKLPAKVESHYTDEVGVRHKREQELSNWHVIQGVNVPLRHDFYEDDEMSQQRFLEEFIVNPPMASELFLEPVVEKK